MDAERDPSQPERDQLPSLPEPGRLRNPFILRRGPGPESTAATNNQEALAEVREKIEELRDSPTRNFQSSLHFTRERFDSVIAYTISDQRRKHFTDNAKALSSLSGGETDVHSTPKNPLAKIGGIVLDIIRYPINPIDNFRRANESVKKIARKLPFAENMRFLRGIPQDAAVALSKNVTKAQNQITTSLLQIRREALPYDGNNPFVRWIVNKYAKKNINMSPRQTLIWFGIGNTPGIGFLISAVKSYIPNVIAPFYDKKVQRSVKTLMLTGFDLAANFYQSTRAVVITQGIFEAYATRGVIGVLAALPSLLANNWEIIAPYPLILAYNPLFIQGRLDQNDYRQYGQHFQDIARMLWDPSSSKGDLVKAGVQGMLTDYNRQHPHNSPQHNMIQLTSLMQNEYAALVKRLDEESKAIEELHLKIDQLPAGHRDRERHGLQKKIDKLTLGKKAYRARLLYLENLHLLMQETGFLETQTE